jgi:hypothetical protein
MCSIDAVGGLPGAPRASSALVRAVEPLVPERCALGAFLAVAADVIA